MQKFFFIIVICLFCISCGVKSDPEYTDPEKKVGIYKILINKA